MQKIKGRKIKAYFQIKFIIPYFFYLIRTFLIIKNPIKFFYSYITYNNINCIKFRNGKIINLSWHPHDTATVFAVIIRRDYGKIKKDSVVVDIGANIGIFSFYAIMNGAKKCYSYEPNFLAAEFAQKNINLNNYNDKFFLHKLAVGSKSDIELSIPIQPSMYNKASLQKSNSKDSQICKTISFNKVLADLNVIDLVKIDCEGAEYEFLFNSDLELLKKPLSYRIEFHEYRMNDIIKLFKNLNYKLTYNSSKKNANPKEGILWFDK